MRLTERRENGGKRKWRQIGQENFKREIRKKGIMPKRKGTLPEAWNRANHRQGSMILYVWPSVSGLTDKIILPGLPAVYDGLFHLRIGRSCAAFRLRLKGTAKKKNRQKPVKAPLWHKRKRNGPCIISLNFCLGVRQSPFLRLCVVGIRSTKILLGDGVPTDKTAFTEKLVWEEKIREIHFKISRFIVTFAYEEFFEGYATRRRMMQ